MLVAPHARWRGLLLGFCCLLQTVPSLALLAALMSRVERIGSLPAMLSLVHWQRLRLIELPLALPLVLAGIRTATSIAVGTAAFAGLARGL